MTQHRQLISIRCWKRKEKSASFISATTALLGLLLLSLLAGCATPDQESEPWPLVLYPSPPAKPRLQFLHGINADTDLGKQRSAFDTFLLGKAPAGEIIATPYDIASVPGKIYILDRMPKKLRVIDLKSRRIRLLDDRGLGLLQDPSGIWVTPEDVKFIADMKRRQIVVFDAADQFVRAYGGPEVFDRPTDVAAFGQRLYVCDIQRNQVVILDQDTGEVIKRVGSTGPHPGSFRKPSHLVVDGDGNLFVTDAFNFRVQQFDPDGNFLKAYGKLGDGLGAFARPKGLALDRSNHLYVVDAAFENVQIFDAQSGSLMLYFGGPGQQAGNMYLPAGIHIDYDNTEYFANFAAPNFKLDYVLYVANTFGASKINVYGFGQWTGPLDRKP